MSGFHDHTAEGAKLQKPTDDRSDRCSNRVESTNPAATENRAVHPFSAPESLTPPRVGRGDPARARAAGPPVSDRPGNRRSVTAPTRVSHARLLRNYQSLSVRDFTVLDAVDKHRFLTTHQIQRFFFTDHATTDSAARITRRVLRRLESLGILERLGHQIGGVRAGSSAITWRVGLVGDQILRLRAGDGVRARRKEPSTRLLQHCLAVADTHLTIRDTAADQRLELLQVQTETACWRDYLDRSGSRLTLKPDLYAALASSDYENHLFIEVDLGTESMPTLLRKCNQYETYRRSGSEQHDHDVFPRVVWVVQDDNRAGKLMAALRTARDLDDDLYRVCLPKQLTAVVTEGLV